MLRGPFFCGHSVVALRWARLVLGWVTVRRQVNHLAIYIVSHPGQLSLAIPPRVGVMSTGEISWEVNRHTLQCTSHVPVVSQYKLVSG